MTTQPSNNSGPIRRAFECEYGVGIEDRAPSGEYRNHLMQIAWTNFRYGWMAAMREGGDD